jgi:hypothetical protein
MTVQSLRRLSFPVLATLLFVGSFSARARAQNFTIVVLPDTQYYSQSYPATLNAQTQWIANNIATLNIKAVVGVGDIVNAGGVVSQWTTADKAFKAIEGQVPYFLPLGNHDYANNDPQNRAASLGLFNQYFGPSRYAPSYSGYGGNYPAGSNENFYGSVTINGKQYLFLMLELYPRMSSLQWAAGIIRANPNAEVILSTHGFGYNDNTRMSLCSQYSAEYYNVGADNDGDELWVNLASQFPNVSMVLSGHISGTTIFTGRQTEPGFNGNIVNELMADYQNAANGGNGYLRILTFQPDQNQIVVSTYSPTLNAYLTDSGNSFTVPWHATSTSGLGTIKGRLKNTACTAISGAKVSYAGGSTTTDNSGNFTLSNVPSGVQTVSVQAAGYPTITKLVPVGATLISNPLFFVSAASGSVSGTLTDIQTGSPIANATVSSSGASTTSDSSGNYTLTGVAAVSAQLTASANGYGNLTQQISVISGATSTLNFALTSTSTPTTGNLTGTVTNSATGNSISGATVLYSGGSAITDANGSYTLSGVTSGTITFTVSAPGMQTLNTNVDVLAGQTTTQNFALNPIATGSVSGTVTDAYTGLAITNATVSFAGGNTATDNNGHYTLAAVPTGTQAITAAATGYQNQVQNVAITQNGNASQNFSLTVTAVGSLAGTVTDALTGQAILGASISYGGGNALTNNIGSYSLLNVPAGTSNLIATAGGYNQYSASVTVTANQTNTTNIALTSQQGAISGTVTDAVTNAAISGATVSYAGGSSTTDGTGKFLLSGVPAGSQSLTVSATGYSSATQSVSVSAGTTTTRNFSLSTAPQVGAIAGKVLNASGTALTGVSVAYSGGSALTDANGNYTLTNVATGTQSLTASLTGYVNASQNVSVTANQTSTLNFTLTASTGSVTGTVTNAANGSALTGATVSYSSGSTTTASNGTFLISNVAPGTQIFTVSLAGYNPASQAATVVGGSITTLNVALSASTGNITGKITNASNGFGLSGATITVAGMTATSASNGTYTVSGVVAGTYTMTVKLSGWTTQTATVTVISGTTVTKNVPLATTGKVAGTVKTASGALDPGVSVTLTGGVIPTTVSLTTNSSGAYTTSWIPVGSYTVTITQTGHSSKSQSATVSAGVTTTLNFTGF